MRSNKLKVMAGHALMLLLLAMIMAPGLCLADMPQDVDMTWDTQTNGNVEITIYEGEVPADTYTLTVEHLQTGQIQDYTVVPNVPLALGGLLLGDDYVFQAIGRDAAGNPICGSPHENVVPAIPELPEDPPGDRVTTMNMIGLNSGNFPFIFSTLHITDIPQDCTLMEEQFTAYEDDVLQTDFFEVTLGNQGSNRLLDMVFIVDNSGSMGGEHAAVVQNLGYFADSLEARGIDFRLGLVRFGQSAGSGNPILVNGGTMTDTAQDFIDNYLSQLTHSGSREPGIAAIHTACNSYSYRPGSHRRFLLITDENSDGGSIPDACACCNSHDIIVDVAVNSTGYGDYYGPGSIMDCTGGLQFNVEGPYDDILDEIAEFIGSLAIVRYRTFNDVYDGVERHVRIELNACGELAMATGTYTPGEAATIQRTPDTIALSYAQQVDGQPLTFECWVTDNFPPYVDTVRLHYRTTGGGIGDYLYLPMMPMGNDLWSVVLPGSAVQPPGVDYYITASDGMGTVSDPAVDPALLPYQIGVYPNEVPLIVHTPVENTQLGANIPIEASVFDTTDEVSQVQLRYREVGDLLFTELPMGLLGGDDYGAVIPGADVTVAGIEYEIRAWDNFLVSAIHGPHLITVLSDPPPDCVWTEATDPAFGFIKDAHGMAWGDYDNDGDQDLFLAMRRVNRLFNNQGGTFTLVEGWPTAEAASRSAIWGDYDDDGNLDLYVVNNEEPNVLYVGDGAGIFTMVDAGDAVDPGAGYNAAWADIDGDNDLDLYVLNEHGYSHLYRNDGGLFMLAPGATEVEGTSRACAFADYDNDGDQDLYVSRNGPNVMLVNEGSVFVDATVGPLGDPGSGKGVAWGDYDNDGDLDLYLANTGGPNVLLNNEGGGMFADVTDALTGDAGNGRSCAFGDYNNDGWLDLEFTNMNGNSKVLKNTGGAFEDATCGDLLNYLAMPILGSAFVDVDDDGDLDLFWAGYGNDEPLLMFRNDLVPAPIHNWLQVDLRGTESNHFGVGSRIVVQTPDRSFIREVSAGSGYLGQSPLTAGFGVGNALIVDIEVHWPSGIVQCLEDMTTSHRHQILEQPSNTPIDEEIPLPKLVSASNYPNPFNPTTIIAFKLPNDAQVTVRVFDIRGREVRSLLDGVRYTAGSHDVTWDGRDDRGLALSSGLYVYHLHAGEETVRSRMLLLK